MSFLKLPAVLALAISLCAQGPPGRGGGRGGFGMGLISRDVPDAAAADRGQKVFGATCGFCHGTNATGGESGPDLLRSTLALDDEKGDKIGPVIRQGRVSAGMPAFPQLTDTQIEDIAAFLRNRQQAAINRGQYEIRNIDTGDPRKGETWFASHCASCHSPTGDLAHISTKYQPEQLISRILYPGGRGGRGGRGASRSRSTVTVTTAAGQTFSGTLEYQDDFDLALRDASGVYRSFARTPGLKVLMNDPLAAHVKLLKTISDADLHNALSYLETLK